VAYALIAVPLIVFEEDIDCMTPWCGKVIIPPTLPFIFVEVAVLGLLVYLLHVKSVFRAVLAYCIFGVAWEMTVGGLVGASPVTDALFVPYVALGYAFVSMLPLEVLLNNGRPSRAAPAQG
jgi:hypothetical protein